jgi:predicted ATPase
MLNRVHIQNFKSLKDVTLNLQPINLLIGPNNSGKTNFLKAFEFMGFAVQQEVIFIPDDFLFKKNNSLDFEFHYVFDNSLPFGNENENYEHIILSSVGEFQFANHSNPRKGNILGGYSKSIDSEVSFEQNYNGADSYQYETGFTVIYNIDPTTIKYAYPLLPNNSIIHGDGSNVVAFLDTLRDKFPDNFNAIQEGLRVCIPEFSQIRFDTITPDERLKETYGDKTFKRIGLFNKDQRVTYWADELSEGTLYFLALLCIVNQPNPPKLLLLEEPEKGIHPRRIREVMEFIRRLVAEKDIQVIMTTHSPLLLDEFADSPESVFIFDKDDEGATHVKNLQRDVIEPDLALSQQNGVEPPNYTDSLGESWKIGFLGGVPR